MLVVFDADVLSLLLDPGQDPPRDPATGDPVERATERLENLVAELEEARARIVIFDHRIGQTGSLCHRAF